MGILRPGRSIICSGSPEENAQTIAGVFEDAGFKRVTGAGEFPIDLKAGSKLLDFAAEHEVFGVLALIPHIGRRVTPMRVAIHHVETHDEGAEFWVELYYEGANGAGARKRFLDVLDAAVEVLQERGELRFIGEIDEGFGRKTWSE